MGKSNLNTATKSESIYKFNDRDFTCVNNEAITRIKFIFDERIGSKVG
jgi:hypothetical protein